MSGLLVGDGASVTVENSIITTNLNNGVTVQAAQVLSPLAVFCCISNAGLSYLV